MVAAARPLAEDLRRRADRQARGLCLGLWSLAWVIYTAPSVLMGHSEPRMYALQTACALIGLGCTWLLFHVLRWASRWARPGRFALVSLAALALILAHAAADCVVSLRWLGDLMLRPAQGLLSPIGALFMMTVLQLAPVYLLFLSGVALIDSLLTVQDRERSLASARAAAQDAQLAALRFQINPHFLFNALNAVTALVGAGRNEEAQAVVGRLSEFFRASLSMDPAALVRVEDELDILGSYLHVEAARFGPKLQVDLDVEDAARDALIPQFLLQPLVENAMKYGVARSKRPVTLTVRAGLDDADVLIVVSDDGAPEPGARAPAGAGVGLANVAARLQATYGAAAGLRTETLSPGFRAEVRLPLLKTRPEQKAA